MKSRLSISPMLKWIALLVIVLFVSDQQATGQSPTTKKSIPPRDTTPVVNDWEPKTGSVNSVIELRGYRLELTGDTEETTRVLFIQNGVELITRATGSSGITNDEFNGDQTLDVIVPEEATL